MEYTHAYIYTPISENSPTKTKYNRLTWQTKKTKNYIYQLRTRLKKKNKNNKILF